VELCLLGEMRQADNHADIYNGELTSQVIELDCNKDMNLRRTSMVDNTHILNNKEVVDGILLGVVSDFDMG